MAHRFQRFWNSVDAKTSFSFVERWRDIGPFNKPVEYNNLYIKVHESEIVIGLDRVSLVKLTFVAILSLETTRAFALVTTDHICTLRTIFARLVYVTDITVCNGISENNYFYAALGALG